MGDVPCFVGMDGAKAQLDIALRPAGERWAVPHDANGIVLRSWPGCRPSTPLMVLANSVRLNFCMAVELSDASGQYA